MAANYLVTHTAPDIHMSIDSLSFLSTILATIGVIGVSVYGAVRFFSNRRFRGAIGILTLIPLWLFAQLILIAAFDKLKSQGIATRAYHLDYAATPLMNVLGAGLVVYLVVYLVRRLPSSPPNDTERAPQFGERKGTWAWLFEPKKLVGVTFIILGIAAMSTFFVYAGVLFTIVGVSLVMDVRIWRS